MTTNERDFILAKARKELDWATGAHYCDCVTDHGAASGFGRSKDPKCEKCDWSGLVKNPGWDGTREHFNELKPSIVSASGGGTARVDPDDGVGPGKSCYSYWISSKGIRLTKGWEHAGTLTRDVTMTWAAIASALTAPQQLELV